METAAYIDLLLGTAQACGLDFTALSTPEFQILRTLHSDRLATAWEHHYWPELGPVERRTFRPAWASGTVYAVTNEVYYAGPKAYYQALVASTGQAPASETSPGVWTVNAGYWAECAADYRADDYSGTHYYMQGGQVYYPLTDSTYQLYAANSTGNLPTDATKWGLLTPFDRYIAYQQPGQTAFSHAFSAWEQDPRNFAHACRVPHQLSTDGVQITRRLPSVWLKLRTRCPVLSGDAFSAATAYAPGQQAYYTSATSRGNFWSANQATTAGDTPESAPTKWDLVAIPLLFRRYLIAGAAADYLRPEGQPDASDRQEAIAEAALDRAVQLVFGQMGQRQDLQFQTR